MKVLLNVESNLGYGADQVKGMTLADLLEAVEMAIEDWGADTEVVPHQINNQYGANFGTVHQWDTFTAENDQEDGEEK